MPNNILQIVLLCFVLVGCSSEYSGVYQSVTAESKWDESSRIIINGSAYELPLYKVIDDRLYLMIQGTHDDRFFQTVVTYPSWGKPEINQLTGKHTEIKSLVPIDWNNWLPKGYGDECKEK